MLDHPAQLPRQLAQINGLVDQAKDLAEAANAAWGNAVAANPGNPLVGGDTAGQQRYYYGAQLPTAGEVLYTWTDPVFGDVPQLFRVPADKAIHIPEDAPPNLVKSMLEPFRVQDNIQSLRLRLVERMAMVLHAAALAKPARHAPAPAV